MKRLTLPAMLLFFTVSSVGQQLSDEQIAAQFFPESFNAYAQTHPYLTPANSWSFLPVDLDHSGRPDYLAVVYGNGKIAALRIIRRSSTSSVVTETVAPMACDGPPSVTAVDLDADGKPELNVSCAIGNRGRQFSSLFKWTRTGLTPLNPVSTHRPGGWVPLQDANFVDLAGDGMISALEPSGTFGQGDDYADNSFDVYSLVGGRFVKSSLDAAYYNVFVRDKGAPASEQRRFAAPAAGTYTLTIVNGNNGQQLVDSAVIAINGKIVVGPDAFSKRARVISAPVSLTTQNTISVELRSGPGALIHVILRPAETVVAPR